MNKTNILTGMLIGIVLALVAALYLTIGYSKAQIQFNNETISTSKQVSNPLKTNVTTNTNANYVFTPEDVKKINDHIDYLADKVSYQVDRAQKNTEYDITRINTNLAIGLALLTIIGGLMPLLINYSSKEDLEKRMNELGKNVSSTTTIINRTTEQANEAEKKSGDALTAIAENTGALDKAQKAISGIQDSLGTLDKSINKIDTALQDAEKKAPYISSLILQNSVARLASVIGFRYYAEKDRYSRLSKIIDGIIVGVDHCANDNFNNHTDDHYFHLITIINDLKVGIQHSPVRVLLSRKLQGEIDEFGGFLNQFTIENKSNFKDLLGIASTKLADINNAIKSN